jgi:4-hydroxy-2-oxoheptanedioate aldolase
MDMPINQFKRALADGSVLFGLWKSLSGSYAVEAIAGAGFDWLMIDTEHSPNDLETVLTHLQILAAYPTEPVVRVPWNDMVTIKRYLDIGAQTLLIPQYCGRGASRCLIHAVSADRRPWRRGHHARDPVRTPEGLCQACARRNLRACTGRIARGTGQHRGDRGCGWR